MKKLVGHIWTIKVLVALVFIVTSCNPTRSIQDIEHTYLYSGAWSGEEIAKDIKQMLDCPDCKLSEIVKLKSEAESSPRSDTEYFRHFVDNWKVDFKNSEATIASRLKVKREKSFILAGWGNGLWDGIYCVVKIDDETNEIKDISFGHRGETEGLGARIVSSEFERQFLGICMSKSQKFVYQRGTNEYHYGDIYVDGISGATVTSLGVFDMIKNLKTKYEVLND